MFLTGCATDRGSVARPPLPTTNLAQQRGEYGDGISYWDDTGSGGKPRIVIDLEQQRPYFYRGDTIVGISTVSTGREGYDTPARRFPNHSERPGSCLERLWRLRRLKRPGRDGERRSHKGSTTARHSLPRRADAILPQSSWGHWHARWLSARLSGVTWLYSVAKANGSSFFSKCDKRHSGGNSSRVDA
jgi:hypothetical protein